MKFLLSFIFLILFTSSRAQFSPLLKGEVSLTRFLNSTTIVVLTEDDCVNEQLKRYFRETWNLTPVQFILDQELEIYFDNMDFSFVFIDEFKVKGEKKLVGSMALFNGGFTERNLVYLSSSLAYIAYDNHGIEKSLSDICKKIPAMVSQLQTTVRLVKDQNIKAKDEEDMREKLMDIYNSKAISLQKKTLLIDNRYKNTKIISVPEFESIYKYDYQFVSSENIEQAITNHESGKLVLFSSYSQFKINKVIDCSTHEIVYCEFETADQSTASRLNQFDDGDMKLLNNTVKKAKEF